MPMSGLDHALLYQARKCITGANVHQMKNAIFCYETSVPDSSQRTIYEKGLRQLVWDYNRSLVARSCAEAARQKAESAWAASNVLNQTVAALLRAQ